MTTYISSHKCITCSSVITRERHIHQKDARCDQCVAQSINSLEKSRQETKERIDKLMNEIEGLSAKIMHLVNNPIGNETL